MAARKSRLGLPQRIALSLGVAGTTSLVCATGLAGWIYWIQYMRVDVGEVTGWPYIQLWSSACRFEDWAQEHGGIFPRDEETAALLLAPKPDWELDPWDRPFRYEVLTPDGTEARVFTLGRDGEPGGERLDGDIVWWMGPEGIGQTSDARVRPVAWHKRD